MANKKITPEEIEDIHGPMNSVAKEDALAWAGAPPVKHLSKLDAEMEREVRAKKKKAKTSSKKHDRAVSKHIQKFLDD